MVSLDIEKEKVRIMFLYMNVQIKALAKTLSEEQKAIFHEQILNWKKALKQEHQASFPNDYTILSQFLDEYCDADRL